MKTSTQTPAVAGSSTSENVRAALAASLNGLTASKGSNPAPRADTAGTPEKPVLNGLTSDAATMAAAAQAALRTATTVTELAQVFDVLQPGRCASRAKRLQYWVERIGTTPLVDVSTDQVDAVLAELEHHPGRRGKLRSGGTVNRFRAALASLIKFARRHRRLPRGWASPLADLPQHKESPGRLRYLSAEEEQRLMAAAALQQWPLLPLVIRMAIVTGLRKGALNGLTWDDVDLDAAVVGVDRTKNGDAHLSPLTPDLVAALRAVKPAKALPTHLIFGGKNPNVPHNYTHAFAQAVKAAGIEGITFHGLRHTSCSRLAQAGRSLLEIADHAGHRNLATTRRYSHLSTKGRAAMVSEVFA
jgi:integrase